MTQKNDLEESQTSQGGAINWKNILWVAAVALVYFVVARFSLLLVFKPEGIAAIWPTSGIFLSALLLTRRELRPWLAGVLFVTDLICEMLAGTPLVVSLLYALALTADAVLSAWLLLRFVGGRITFSRTRELAGWLLLSVLFSNMLTSLLAAGASLLLPGTSFWASWRAWAASDGAGNLVVTPLVLGWAAYATTWRKGWRPKRLLEGALLFILMALVNILAFSQLSGYGLFSVLLLYLVFPFLVWAAIRFGVRGVASATFIVGAITIYYAYFGHFIDIFLRDTPLNAVLAVQLYLAIMAIPALILAAVMTERRQAEQALRESEAMLKSSQAIGHVGSWELDIVYDQLSWSDEVYRMFGVQPQEFKATNEAFLEFVHPDDRAAQEKAYSSSLRDGSGGYEIEHRIIRQDSGAIRFVHEKCEHVKDATGRIVRSVGIVQDITERKVAEEALLESETRYRSLFEDSPVALWEEDFSAVKRHLEKLKQQGVTDFRTFFETHPDVLRECVSGIKVLDVNKTAMILMRAMKKDQLTGNLAQFPGNELDKGFIDEFVRIAAGQAEFGWEGPNYTLDGGMVMASMIWRAAPGYEDTLEKIIFSMNDITERKRAEEALRESEARFRSLYENATIGMYRTTPNGQILLANPTLLRMLGYGSFEELSQRNLSAEGYEPEYPRSEFQERIEREGGVNGLESSWKHKDGSVIFVRESARVIKDENDQPLYYEGTVEDITERQQAENHLRASEDKFSKLFHSSPDAILLSELNSGKIIEANKSFEEYSGYSRQELIGHSVLEFDMYSPADRQRFVSMVKDHKVLRNAEFTLQNKTREILHVLASAELIEINNIVHSLTILHDITERKRAEEALQNYNTRLEAEVNARTRELLEAQDRLVRQEKLATLGQLAGGVGHELRNPLGVINTSIYYLKMVQPEADGKIKKHHDIIEQEVRNADKIITDLLDFSRIKSVEGQPFAVADLVKRTLERFPVPPTVELTLEVPAGLPDVFADLRQMEQVLGNLVTNGCQAMTKGGSLTISASVQNDFVTIAVKDTGTGITPENRKKLFEPLFTTKTRGIGLGLAVSKKLAEANGGRIEVESEPGKGSTFTLVLPVVKP